MNPKLGPLFSRRSIRQYLEKDIPKSVLDDLLEAAMAAPSAAAADPWHFLMVENKAKLQKMSEALPHGKMLAKAAAGFLVCGDIEKAHSGEISYLLQDCSAAIENMLLAASLLGLGACWLGVHPREDRMLHLHQLFELPERIIPVSVIALGYPAQEKEARTRLREEAIHFEKW